MGGITRQFSAEQTQGYMTFGKLFLVANGKQDLFDTIEAVNVSEVKVGINIGGTNEKFSEQGNSAQV
ncbi:hypothetical protein [Psychromonas sp. MB-3u-54]|uniref:hypothetical protein n=1 Tax=Psychromonas sp. MB-3u-54 TaxID=2058319 RepID=UPI0018E2FA6E|nr:hypothetical protein [Psychromonas sp. MB-3u-54]